MTPIRRRALAAALCLALAAGNAAAGDTAAESAVAPLIRDQRGQPVPLVPPARRAITFNSVLWLYLTLDQGAGHLAGASASTVRIVTSGLLGRIFPAAARLPSQVAADGYFLPNVEAILQLRPDAVFQWAGRNDPAYLQPLEQAGLPVIGLTQTQSDDDFFATARLVGAVSGTRLRAEALVDRYRTYYAALAAELAPLTAAAGTCPRVLYLWKFRPLIPVDGANFHGRLLARSGGCNAAESLRRPAPVSLETVLTWDPEVIVLYCCDRVRPADLEADPVWRVVRAVRQHRVYKVPAGGSRFADIVEGPLFSRWLAELLYPALPARLRQDLRTTVAEVYGATLDDATLDQTLQLEDNRHSRDYQRFAAPATGGR